MVLTEISVWLCGCELLSSEFNNEKTLIRQIFDNAGFASLLTNNVIRDYAQNQNKTQGHEDKLIISPALFKTSKDFTLLVSILSTE